MTETGINSTASLRRLVPRIFSKALPMAFTSARVR